MHNNVHVYIDGNKQQKSRTYYLFTFQQWQPLMDSYTSTSIAATSLSSSVLADEKFCSALASSRETS